MCGRRAQIRSALDRLQVAVELAGFTQAIAREKSRITEQRIRALSQAVAIHVEFALQLRAIDRKRLSSGQEACPGLAHVKFVLESDLHKLDSELVCFTWNSLWSLERSNGSRGQSCALDLGGDRIECARQALIRHDLPEAERFHYTRRGNDTPARMIDQLHAHPKLAGEPRLSAVLQALFKLELDHVHDPQTLSFPMKTCKLQGRY